MELYERIKHTISAVFNEKQSDTERIDGITYLMHLEIMAIATQYARFIRNKETPDYAWGFDDFIRNHYPTDK